MNAMRDTKCFVSSEKKKKFHSPNSRNSWFTGQKQIPKQNYHTISEWYLKNWHSVVCTRGGRNKLYLLQSARRGDDSNMGS